MYNIIDGVNNSFYSLSYEGGLSSYTQASCTSTLTKDGQRIYRPANHDGANVTGHGWDSWGGMVLSNSGNRFGFQKGHTYILKFHAIGKTTEGASDIGWNNQVGWNGGGLVPSPSNVSYKTIPSNFNGEMDCYYKWTISDDVYKVCTSTYSSFTSGTTYLSYNGFKCGWGYTYDTGAMGTDIYFSNFRMYDITNGVIPADIEKSGILKCEDFMENKTNGQGVKIMKSNTVLADDIKEI